MTNTDISEERSSVSSRPPLLKEATTASSTSSSELDDSSVSEINDIDSNGQSFLVDDGVDNIEHREEEWSSSNVDKIAELWKLSDQERTNLEQLGLRLRDIDHFKNNPGVAVRFLRGARPRGDLKAAETMFRKMIQWRMENNVDTILQDYQPPPDLLDYWPMCTMDRLDKDGDPICVDRGGRLDGAGLLKRYGHDEIVRLNVWLREAIDQTEFYKEYPSKMGHPVKQVTIVEDVGAIGIQYLTNYGVQHMLRDIMRMDEANYPENVKRIIVIGLPKAFMIVWNILKPLFGDTLCEKMVFTSSGSAAEKVLSQYMDLEVLPDCLVPGVGKGRAVESYMTDNLEGGPLPPLKTDEARDEKD